MTDQKVVFIDGVGAGRRSVESCRDGVQWIIVGDRVYWPLSDSDAKRLQSACCGNGSFDGPTSSAGDCVPKTEREHAAAREVEWAETSWQRGFQQGLEANRLLATQAMDALKKERDAHAETNRAMTDALLMMEEREQRDEALLRQALEALLGQRGEPDWHTGKQRENAIAALRERLGEGAEQ